MRAGFVPYAVLFPPFLTPFLLLDVWQIASLAVETCRQIDTHTHTHTHAHPQEDGPRLWVVMPGKRPVDIGGGDDDGDGSRETDRRDIHLSGYSGYWIKWFTATN
ncbi:hypothetical protein LX32DRAFT_643761 [Colletotrichum zoysiae]|uniref:Uncharacterized protein n=1 Tax=Colletotrichum zoysiae TaxID=1216348 RepID=A0AAD9HA08_9PEZI|nr:hypothetical protein LX32DRAFT_643761 [Colletotrichum zoysiae]